MPRVKTEDLLTQAMSVLGGLSDWTELKEVSEDVKKTNIYVRKCVNIFDSEDLKRQSEEFKKTMFDWYQKNLVVTLAKIYWYKNGCYY